ncbi:MAG: hypothetical protein QM754_20995 [Tepidisphaeraceae bacterium]
MAMLSAQLHAIDSAMTLGVAGRVAAVSGLTLEAEHLPLPVGSLCKILAGGQATTPCSPKSSAFKATARC